MIPVFLRELCTENGMFSVEREVHRLRDTLQQQQIWGYAVGRGIKITWDRPDVSCCLFCSITLENADPSSPDHSETW